MMVNSPLAIYSVVIGAKLYDDIFNIIVSFGILYIPLVVIFFSAIKAYFECPHGGGTTLSLNKVILGLVSYILVVMLAVVPTRNLEVSSIGYKPACTTSAVTSRFGQTGTTYDEVFQRYEYENIRLPLLMAFALEGASGFTNAAITMLPCKIDVQKIQGIINTTQLPRDMVDEVKRFTNECYVKAITRFDVDKPKKDATKDTDKQIYRIYKKNYDQYDGDRDLAWIGSHTLQELYYDDLYAMEPTKPFPYNLYTDYTLETDFKNKDKKRPVYGYPNCRQWWMDQTYGLQKRLIETAQNNTPDNEHLGRYDLLTQVGKWRQDFMALFGSADKSSKEDIISRGVLSNKSSNAGFGANFAGWVDNNLHQDYIADTLAATVGQIDMGIDAFKSGVKRYQMAQEVPIIQAVLFVLMLALGPIIMILGRLQISVIVSYYFILCSSVFIPFLLKMINFLEQSIHESMGYGLYSTEQYTALYNWFTQFYYMVPLVYLMVISISGVQVGSALSQMMGSSISGGGASVMRSMGKIGFAGLTGIKKG